MSDRGLELEFLRAAWAAVARYRVIRSERGQEDQVLASGLELEAARALAQKENRELAPAPGFRPYVMSRPIVGIELENVTEAMTAYKARALALLVPPPPNRS